MPAWVTPPAFTVGEDLTAALMNQIGVDISSFLFQSLVFDELFGSTTGVGTSYTGVRGKMGSKSSVTPSAGYTVTYAAAFPSGTYLAIVIPAAAAAFGQYTVSSLGAGNFAINMYALGGSTVLTSGSVSFWWVALGN
jgi:hypothetical protein